MKYRMHYRGISLHEDQYPFEAKSDDEAIERVENKLSELKARTGCTHSFISLRRIDVEEKTTPILFSHKRLEAKDRTQNRMILAFLPRNDDLPQELSCPEGF